MTWKVKWIFSPARAHTFFLSFSVFIPNADTYNRERALHTAQMNKKRVKRPACWAKSETCCAHAQEMRSSRMESLLYERVHDICMIFETCCARAKKNKRWLLRACGLNHLCWGTNCAEWNLRLLWANIYVPSKKTAFMFLSILFQNELIQSKKINTEMNQMMHRNLVILCSEILKSQTQWPTNPCEQ